MDHPLIRKHHDSGRRAPNLADYAETCRSFRWDAARAELAGLPGGSINIAHEAVDRHVAEGHGDRVALRLISRDWSVRDLRYAELAALSSRFAHALEALGVGRGERVFTLLGRVPELYVAALGTWKRGAVLCPLFSVFGPEPIRARMAIAEPTVLVTTTQLYRRKVAPIRAELPFLKAVVLTDGGEDGLDLGSLLDAAPDRYEAARTVPGDLATLHFTSGTTGRPKGAMHVHEAVVAHRITARYALDLREDDLF